NVALNHKVAEHGLVTVDDPDPDSEAQVVIQTKWVTPDELCQGWFYTYVVSSLFSARGLWYTARYLNARGMMSYAAFFRAFVAFCDARQTDPLVRFCARSIRGREYIQYSNIGALLYQILHSDRESFDALLAAFVAAQDFWRDETARVCFEVDLLNR